MSDNFGMRIGVEGEKDFKKALSDINQAYKVLGSEMKLIASEFDKNDNSLEALTARNKVLNKEIDAQKQKIETLRAALQNATESFGENDRRTQAWQIQLNNAQAALNGMERELEDNNKALENAENGFDDAGDEAKEFAEDVNDAADKTETAGNRLEKLGTVLKAVGAAIGAAVGAASAAVVGFAKQSVEVGAQFDATMSQVAAVSGATGEEFDALREKAMEMGASTKFSATESAEAMEYMAMAGWKTGDMLGGIEGIMHLASASGEELGSVSDIVTDALTAFGLSAKDSGHFADVLAVASSNANTNVSMMGETFKYVAPVAGSLGFSAEDTATAIGLMANSGIKASQAGTSLRTIMSQLTGPIDLVGEQLGQVTIETTNADGSMRELGDIITDCRAAFSQLTESEQANATTAIFGRQAMSGWLAMMNASETDVEKLTSAISTASGDFEGLADVLQNTGIQWEKYSGEYWSKLGGGISGLAEEIAYNLKEVGTSAEKLQEYLVMEYDLSTEDAQAAISAVKDNLDLATGAAERMANTMQDNLAGDITIFKSALEGAQIVLSDELTPAIREFVQFGTDGISRITKAFQNGGIKDAINEFSAILTEGIKKISENLPNIVGMGVQIVQSLLDGITKNIPTLAKAATEIITQLLKFLVNNLPKLVEAGMQTIVSLIQGISQAIPTLIPKIVPVVTQIAQTIVDNLPLILDAALQLITGLAQGILDALPVLIEALPNIILAIVDFVISSIPQIIDAGIQLLTSLVSALPEIITAVVAAIPQIVDGLITAVLDSIPQLIDAGIKLLVSLIQNLPQIITTVVAAIPQIISSLVTAIIGSIPQLIDAGIQLFTALIANLPQIIVEIVKAVPQIISGLVSAFGDGFSTMVDVGKNLVIGLWNGISSLGSWICDKVSSWAGDIWNSICDFFGIHSPSTKAHWAGEMIDEGFAGGVKKNGKNAVNAVEGMANDIMDVMTDLGDDMKNVLPTDFSAEINSSLNTADISASVIPNGFTAASNTFDVTIPLTIDGLTLTKIISQIQWNQNTVTVRNMAVGM